MLDAANALILRAFNEVMEEGYRVVYPPVGVMIEVPAAVYQAKQLAARADFLSVGSNDLTQYLLAVDRNNARVADLYQSMHPAVLTALQEVVEGGHSEGVDVSICGELAGDPGAAVLLLAMGYDVLSMSATNLPKVKSVLRAISMEQAKAILAEVMCLQTAEAIEEVLNTRLQDMGIKRLYRPNV